MPIYEYRCSSCGHELEALQKISEPPLSTCPSCSNEALVKLVSAAGFQLKGSGWYATDFKSNGSKPSKPGNGEAKQADGKAGGDAKAGDSKASETKGDAQSSSSSSGSCGTNCSCH